MSTREPYQRRATPSVQDIKKNNARTLRTKCRAVSEDLGDALGTFGEGSDEYKKKLAQVLGWFSVGTSLLDVANCALSDLTRHEHGELRPLTHAGKTNEEPQQNTGEPQVPPVFCKDCKHFSEAAYKDPAACTAQGTKNIDLVHGYMNIYCHTERRNPKGACGPAAKLFAQAGADGVASIADGVASIADGAGDLIQSGSNSLPEHGGHVVL